MEEEIQLYLSDAEESMEKAISHTKSELVKIRAGKASPAMLDGITVDYYGTPSPIGNVASVNTPDARTIIVKPWEKPMVAIIDKAIRDSDLGINPQNDGEQIILSVPPLTEERRRDLMKKVKEETENGKISVRNVRKDANSNLKKLLKEGASEDAVKGAEDEVQELTNKFVKVIDDLYAKKEVEVMTV
ncbi:ribosome recycling factor [Sediminitomix flava]|uniref:Ribosome-recycling factor n=1 Tax=Sediminitomix flava TaxID=379075 RepID=A0A315ZGT5_SEDFL|nr:ribosome recycling factor [Sediminitomix flava]PWJ44562.1 ribosome recycling factor [Sediminitomix flava]